MWFWCLLSLLSVSLLLPAPASAQTAVAVDLNKATLVWTWVKASGGDANEFRIKCGAASGVYTGPRLVVPVAAGPLPPTWSVPVKSISTALGAYWCVVVGANEFGESPPPPEVAFRTGTVPVAPSTLLIQGGGP